MKADELSYTRAVNRSLIGLALHVFIGVALIVYGVGNWGRDHAATTIGLYALLGAGIWLMLAVLFDQAARERREAAEAEAFAASDAAAASVFEQGAMDLRVAAKRLRLMHRLAVPIVSLLVAGALLALGWWRYNGASARSFIDPLTGNDPFVAPPHSGWAIGLGLTFAFIAFLIARYASGMAKQSVWSNLRGGAAAAAGVSLMTLALAVCHTIDAIGPDTPLRYLQVAIPIALMILGGEVLLNFVLDLYRPRKAGEAPRAAFESRVLGFAAAPDRIAESINEAINYQLGFNVTSGWFYKLLSRSLWKLGALGLLVLWGMTAMVVVLPHQAGLVLRHGRVVREIGPGLHFKFPWPIDRVLMPEYTAKGTDGQPVYRAATVTGVRTLNVGSLPPPGVGPILWTSDHALGEETMLVQPSRAVATGQGAGGGGGLGLEALAAEVPLVYTIDDLEAYERLGPPEMREDMLTAIARRELTWYLSSVTLSDVLSDRRGAMAEEIKRRIDDAFAEVNFRKNGKPVVRVESVGLQGVHPPQKTAQSFEDVVGAGQKFLKQLEDARSQRTAKLNTAVGSVELGEKITAELDKLDAMQNQKAPAEAQATQRRAIQDLIEQAGGEAASIILKASADRWTRVADERTRLTRYQGELGSYLAAPSIYMATLYLDAVKEAVSNARVFVVDKDVYLRAMLDLKEKQEGSGAFNPGDENASR